MQKKEIQKKKSTTTKKHVAERDREGHTNTNSVNLLRGKKVKRILILISNTNKRFK